MNDTLQRMAARYEEMIMARLPEERLRMGCSMFDTAKQIAKSAIFARKQRTSPAEVKKEIFIRFYGQEFNEIQKQKVLSGL